MRADHNEPKMERQGVKFGKNGAKKNGPKTPKNTRNLAHVIVNCRFQTQTIRKWTKPTNLPGSHRRDQGSMAKFLPGMDVREVNFNGPNPYGRDGIPQGH